MPELPDLQVFSKNLKKQISNKKIVSVEVFNKAKLNIDTNVVESKLLETKIVDIVREGKELYFQLDNNDVFSVHLMLNGKFDICSSDEIPDIKYKILSMSFEDEQALVVSDFQGLCKITFNPARTDVPDALGESFTFEYLLKAVNNNRRKNAKAFLINQDIIKGIGNAYADEILWKANISPESTIGKIPEEKLEVLYDAISYILKDAIINIEKIAPDIISGEERSFLKVHNSKKKQTDEGEEILIKKIASKTTYYTEKQQLFK